MQVTKNITLDLLETGSPVIIKAKQNDRNTRYIAAHLYVGRLDYQVPSGTEIAFRYKKPDGTAGFYDALPDNSPAITVSGNTVTVELVEQVLTAAGCVHCEINMYNAASEKLTTFTFEISVEESVLTDAEIISSDYYNVLTAEIAKALQAVTDATEQAENAAQSAQDAADSAAMSKDWAAGKPVTYSGTPVSIAYAGAQRIDSLTLYGENAQGGTTEAPMALTGVDSVFVGGRNLLPKATKTQTIYGVTFTPNPDGSVSVSGTCAGGIATYNYADNLIPISPNQVVCLSGASQLVKVVINEKTPSGAFVRNVLVDRGQGISGTLTKQKEENILYATLQVQIGDTPNLTIYPMLNLGNTAMPYEPYQGSVTPLPIPRPLRRVGDVQDVCRTRVKSIYDKRIVLDGTESWYWYSDNSYIFASNFLADNKYGVAPGCSHYQGSPRHAPNENQVIINSNGTIAIKDPAWKNAEDAKAYLAAQKSAGTPVTVYYQSTAYDGTNGLDVCLTEYQTVFAELDGTESQFTYAATETKGLVVGLADDLEIGFLMLCSHGVYSSTGTESIRVWRLSSGKVGIYLPESLVTPYGYEGTVTTVKSAAAGYFAAQKEAGTPVQIAYQLATPETYATDPIDFDNAAGPLHVISGGELEVRMTELIGTRSDVSNNTVAFSEAAQDADISSGEKLTVLFGKIKKRFAVIASNLSNIYNKTESDERYATAAQGEKADNALPKTGGTISGNLTVVQDLTVQRAFNGMRIKAGVKIITTPTTSARAELFNSDTLNTLFGTTGVSYTNGNCVVLAANGDYDFHPRVVTSGYVNSKWAVFTADAGNFTISTMRVNYIAIKFA